MTYKIFSIVCQYIVATVLLSETLHAFFISLIEIQLISPNGDKSKYLYLKNHKDILYSQRKVAKFTESMQLEIRNCNFMLCVAISR